MTLLITIFAAVAVTLVWYLSERARDLKVGLLVFAFWGAALMWLVDAVVEYVEVGADYFRPAAADLINDAFLGLSVIALALVAWIITVLVTDPDKKIARILKNQGSV